MDPLVLAIMLVGGAFVLAGVRFLSTHGKGFPRNERWSPAKQLIFEEHQERNHRLATYSMTAGLFLLWGSVIFLALPLFTGGGHHGTSAAEALESADSHTSVRIAGCVEQCGDGVCSAMSCIHEGCACAESYKTCKKDCPAPPGA